MRWMLAMLAAVVASGEARSATEITDAKMIAAFEDAVVQSGYTCSRAITVSRLDYQDPTGQPFMVACAEGIGFFYRRTVRVEPWK